MEDKRITELLWRRKESAISAMARKYGKRLLATAWNILGSQQDAEETENDTYYAVWNAVPPARPDPLSGYVYRTGRNLALDKLRYLSAAKRDRQYEMCLDELMDSIPGPVLEETVEARELGRLITHFLSGLTSMQRVMFLRRYYFGDAVRMIAQDLEITPNACSVRLSRIRDELRNYLEREGYCYEK